ncbi:putative aldo-keto reductase (AKR13) [Planoprotostelium fungivorum]|uniref:Putative aldo-keto reductase (AKR13) n=1 Tax=Planoprotostelium fungivorum TaxID=1890364 RepID=A0A2P6NQP7_9EUKA|nr:putative aldo-keto reductase (AKR13) [Planoprotostelium fungivorum]
MSLPTRSLGKNGPQVTALGFGTMGLSAFYGPTKPDNERFAVLDAAFAAGELNWDSADVYMDSEDLLGKWFAANPGKREKIFLATKFGAFRIEEDGQRGPTDSTPEYCKKAIERSLKRLGLPYVDLYYAHRLDGKTPVEKTVAAMAELKAEGKIKHIGLSEVSAESLRRAYKVHPIAAVQIEYSPFTLDIEDPQIALLQACRELGVAVVAYSPLGRGMLSGKLRSTADLAADDFRRMIPRFSEENFPKNLALVDEISRIAEHKSVTPSQLTLAWLLAQGDDIIPIPGTTSIDRLKENLGSLSVQLTEEEKNAVRKSAEEAEVHGVRYPPAFLALSFADTPAL